MAPGWFPPWLVGGWGPGGVMRAWHAIGALGRHAAPNVGPAPYWLPLCSPLFFWGVGAGLVCGWVGCELHSGREHQMRLCALACPGCGVVCVISFVSLIVFAGVFVVFAWILFVVFVCFYGRSVDALASGADEGRGGLR